MNVQFFDSEAEGAGVEFEDRCRTGRPLDFLPGLLQDPEDVFAFDSVKRI